MQTPSNALLSLPTRSSSIVHRPRYAGLSLARAVLLVSYHHVRPCLRASSTLTLHATMSLDAVYAMHRRPTTTYLPLYAASAALAEHGRRCRHDNNERRDHLVRRLGGTEGVSPSRRRKWGSSRRGPGSRRVCDFGMRSSRMGFPNYHQQRIPLTFARLVSTT